MGVFDFIKKTTIVSDDFFSSIKTPAANTAASKELLKRGTEKPEVATQKIAGLSPLEQTTQRLSKSFVESPASQARAGALEKAQGFAEGGNVLDSPDLNAIFDRITAEGDRSSRGLARALRITGNAPGVSAKGRDILGRSVTETQARLVEAASPFLESERGRQFAAIPLIDDIARAETEERLVKLGVGERAGAQTRMIEQLINDAEFNRAMSDLQIRFEIQPGILNSVIAANPSFVDTGFLGKINELAQTTKNVASAGATVALAGSGFGGAA